MNMWSLTTTSFLMAMSAAPTHVCKETVQTSFLITDATAHQDIVEDTVKAYSSMIWMA